MWVEAGDCHAFAVGPEVAVFVFGGSYARECDAFEFAVHEDGVAASDLVELDEYHGCCVCLMVMRGVPMVSRPLVSISAGLRLARTFLVSTCGPLVV